MSPEERSARGHEALQALLAFSSLHEQIRRRKAEDAQQEVAPESWGVEKFVLDEVLRLVAERALAITGADGAAIALADGDRIVCRASAGEIAPPPGTLLNPESGFSGACFRTGQIIRCDDAEQDSRVDVEVCRRLGTRSMVAVPLCEQHRVVGLIEAFCKKDNGFNDGDVRSLNLLSELILAALQPKEETRVAVGSQETAGTAHDLDANPEPRMPSLEDIQAFFRELPAEAESEDQAAAENPTILSDYAEKKHARRGWIIVAIVVLLAVLAGLGVWWKLRQGGAPGSENAPPANSNPSAAHENATQVPVEDQQGAAADISGATLINGIRHWSSDDSSTVVIDLGDQVQYEAHRLSDPPRIYFDLHQTRIAPGVDRSVEIDDALLVRVRVALTTPDVTRVVLETKGPANFSVSLDPSPYRLVVELRNVGAPPRPRAKVDLFGPAKPDTAMASIAPELPRGDEHARVPKLRIALDAGHGGWDLGTVGSSGLLEKDLVLDIVARLGSALKKRLGAEVIYTRRDDVYVPLERRAEIANLAQADLFISVHANYSNLASARGVETYYTNTFSSENAHTRRADPDAPALQPIDWSNVDVRVKTQQSRGFAASVQRALVRKLSQESAGIRDRGVKEASYVVLTGSTMPAVLAEVSFVSSPEDERNLRSPEYRQQIAEALYKGVAGYGPNLRRVDLASAAGRSSGSF